MDGVLEELVGGVVVVKVEAVVRKDPFVEVFFELGRHAAGLGGHVHDPGDLAVGVGDGLGQDDVLELLHRNRAELRAALETASRHNGKVAVGSNGIVMGGIVPGGR